MNPLRDSQHLADCAQPTESGTTYPSRSQIIAIPPYAVATRASTMAILIAGQIVPRESVSVTTDPDLETDRLAAGFKTCAAVSLLFRSRQRCHCTAAGPR